MEAALLGGVIKGILPKLGSLVDEKYKLQKGVKSDIKFLEKELELIAGHIDDEISKKGEDHGVVPRLLIEDLRELAYGIEDCLDRHMYRVLRKQQSSVLRRTIQFPKTLLMDLQLAEEMQQLRKFTMEAHERRQRYPLQAPQPTTAAPAFDPGDIREEDLVGIDGPRAELQKQLAEEAKGKLKVIALVGFCGLGKSTLAANVYNREINSRRFEQHAWVCAGHKSSTEVLTELLSQITNVSGSSQEGTSMAEVRQLRQHLREQLKDKRYLIVIDDIRTKNLWEELKSAFPDIEGISSRILVTTTIQSVANVCSSAESYVHKMKRLDEECSKQLFTLKTCLKKDWCDEQPDSIAILKKCDGQPLALVTIGQFLHAQGWPIGSACKDISNKLHYRLESDFQAMRQVLIQNYTSLPGHALKACLLYFGMFPSDHHIKKKNLFRRWSAEGFVEFEPSASLDPATAFDKLKDQNIIEPILVSNNENVKTCQTYGMMHEFILHMSVSQHFVTLLCDDMTKHNYIRRLSVHRSADTDGNNLDTNVLSHVRSLTIFEKASESILDFKKYHLLRVLDLEKCNDVKNDHLKSICNLILLKYLSLGKNVTELPRGIAKLKVLESLDLRGSMVNILPAEVFRMPCLIHLFGKFRLEDTVKPKCKVHDFLLKGKSKLQTLAGFITDGRQGYLSLIGCMKKLGKLTVWYESSADAGSTKWTDLQMVIQQFIQDESEASSARSLSLHFDQCFDDFLDALKGPCYLSSMKLHGKLNALPKFIISLRGLEELCISFAKLKKEHLESLSELRFLKYLKVFADDIEKFTLKRRAFPKLLNLCFELHHQKFPTVSVQEGCMPYLVRLQLLCEDLDGLCGIKMEYLDHLKEIVLDHRVNPYIIGKWEDAAREHPNKPKVLITKMADLAKMGPKEDSIVSKAAEIGPSIVTSAPEEPKNGDSIQHSTNFRWVSCRWMCSVIHAPWYHELFVPWLPTLRGLCFVVLILCFLGCLLPFTTTSRCVFTPTHRLFLLFWSGAVFIVYIYIPKVAFHTESNYSCGLSVFSLLNSSFSSLENL